MNVHVLLAKPFQFNITHEFSVTLSQGLGWSNLVFCRAFSGTPSLQIFYAPLQISSKEKRKTKSERGRLREESFGGSGRGVENEGEGWVGGG